MSENRQDFLTAIRTGVLLSDGAMGTMLYQKGIFVSRCFDELNLREPELVKSIHGDYIKAGSNVIETNTFGANRYKLGKYGLEKKLIEINRTGVEIAREAVGDRHVFVLGSVGPLGRPIVMNRGITPQQAHEAFSEQVMALVEAGVDGIIIETISHLGEMAIALEAAREVDAKIPIVGQFTFADENSILAGASMQEAGGVLEEKGADVFDANCAVGPRTILDVLIRLTSMTKHPVSVMPNAGSLEYVDERLFDFATSDYFTKYAKRFINVGARLIGGCCGTTPDHIRSMAGAARALGESETGAVRFKPVAEVMRFLPLASFRNAEFLHNEVPGMTIPESVRDRMHKAGEKGAEEGIVISQEMLQEVMGCAQGVYVMPPFNRYSTALSVLDVLPGIEKGLN